LGGPQTALTGGFGGRDPSPHNHLFVLYKDGNPAGMAELDLRKPGNTNISYSG
jgi:hypothetical protein